MSTLFTIYPISCSVYILAQWVNVLHSLVGFSESTIVVNNLSGSNFEVIHRVADPHLGSAYLHRKIFWIVPILPLSK